MDGLALSRHPIPKLIAKAHKEWAEKVIGQSQTLSEARMTYIERYEAEPPQGFNDWFAKALRASEACKSFDTARLTMSVHSQSGNIA